MKILSLTASALLMSAACASAADIPSRSAAPAAPVSSVRQQFYIEGQLGAAMVNDVDTATYSGSAYGYTFTGVKATFDYKTALAYGAEVGVANVMGTPFRLGLSYAGFKAEVNKLTGSGTVAYGGTTYTLSASATRSQLSASGANFDNRVHLFMANGYYDFNTGTALRPFVGVGIGIADIENAKNGELALSVSAGVQYDLTSQVYVGGKLVGYYVTGPKDKLGLSYEGITAGAALASIGVRF